MTFLCHLSDLDRTGAKGVVLADGRDVIVVRSDGGIRAFTNSCPHQGVPLETFPDRFLNEDGSQLICSTHGARFRVEDGYCISGPCQGRSLKPADVEIDNGDIFLLI